MNMSYDYMKLFIISIFVIISSISLQAQNNMKLIYIGDPMCSWCYGIAPEWNKLKSEYQSKMEIEYVMGGLRPYFDKPISEMKDFLSDHWKHVNEASGQEFNYGILDRNDLNYDTEPPSRAVVVVKELKPDAVGTFFTGVQKLFYKENKDMNKSESYHELLASIDIDGSSFDNLFHTKEIKEATKAQFDSAKILGVTSFPTVLLQIGEEHFIVASGYSTSDKMGKTIEKLISRNN